MTRFMALNISVSEDGFMAGEDQAEERPLGRNGELLHSWAFVTESFKNWHGATGGNLGIDNDFIERGFTNIGATIMGRNMFGPIRGPWIDDEWQGWWGPQPGYRHPVFVLTHYERPDVDMGNGTIFHFITGGIDRAYDMASSAANGQDVRVGGGAQTIQQFLESGKLDELHVAKIPITLGAGEPLFSNREVQLQNYALATEVTSNSIIHQTFVKVNA